MSLRQLAETDLGLILEDNVTGFGWPIKLTNPDGITIDLTGFSNDIAQVIDPDTGQAVSGRSANCSLRISSINKLASSLSTVCGDLYSFCGDPNMACANISFGLPRSISDASLKPWLVTFFDVNAFSYTFKIIQSNPDRGLGLINCLLEFYNKND